MFERFTDRARRVVVLAQGEARMLNHSYIGTEHILLGLVGEGDGVAAKALEQLGISLEGVRAQVLEIIGEGDAEPTGHIPFTPRAKKILELSLREAQQLQHKYIGTEHILLGVVREGEGVAAQVLGKLGADLISVRQQVINLLSGYPGKEAAEGVVVEEGDVEAAMGAATIERRRGPAWRVERLGPNVGLRRREGDPERTPVCPRCDADLVASVRYRVQDVAHEQEGVPPRTAAFLYCAECGRVVVANLLEPDTGDPASTSVTPEA
ncbi:MAG TPA: Clp protease N-terminal domain-containing protein, partial [Actinomycetota bacterium]|nr:Clp protease N-terminal domain-containing protein [Actinomycetota bacterium]